MNMKIIALVLFVLTYVCLLAFPNKRAYISVGFATAFVILGIMPTNKVFSTIDWNVIFMIMGTMGTVELFIKSKMPILLGDLIVGKAPNVKWAIIFLSLFSGIISAFVDNVATVLMVAPIAIGIAKKLKISPVPSIIAIAISSNLQGAATLVGDTTSILLGGQAGLDFFDFFIFQGKMGMFWVVQLAAIATVFVLLVIFRDQNQQVSIKDRQVVNDYFPTFLLLGTIILLILTSFIPADKKPAITNGLICVVLFGIGLIRDLLKTGDKEAALSIITQIDYFTLILLSGLFVVVGGITEAGIVDDISKVFVNIGNDNIFLIYTIIVWLSVLLSAVIDNIPYVATMLPVVAGISSALGVSPYLLYFGLLSGATLGGNLTPIGASANITALGILRKDGHEVSAKDFMKISVPFTLVAVFVGYILVWVIWK